MAARGAALNGAFFRLVGFFFVVYCCIRPVAHGLAVDVADFGGSSYNNGDLVLTERITYWPRVPRRWEVLCFTNDEGSRVMKRVVGLPGEQVSMQTDGVVEINGAKQPPPAGVPVTRYVRYGNMMATDRFHATTGITSLATSRATRTTVASIRPCGRSDSSAASWLVVWPWSHIGRVNP